MKAPKAGLFIPNTFSCVLALLFVFNYSLSAQHAVSASGSDISGTGGSISYTVGQVSYMLYHDASGSAALGVQQPHEIYVYPGIENHPVIPPFVTVFPNPVQHLLTILLDEDHETDVVAVLYDITGKTLEQITITGRQASLDMGHYARAVYFLRVYQGDHSSRVFRVVKN